MQERLANPADPATFLVCKLNHGERKTNAAIYALHRDLLKLRRDDSVFRAQRADLLEGATLGPDCFVIRWFGQGHDDRLLIVNFGRDLVLDPMPRPLLAPPKNSLWLLLWSSNDVAYGGTGTPRLAVNAVWRLPVEAAVVLLPTPRSKMVHAY
jgi:maltooligosyltrehalose trehalohydrolase